MEQREIIQFIKERRMDLSVVIGVGEHLLDILDPFYPGGELLDDEAANLVRSLKSGRAWLGEVLKHLGGENPYPSSMDASLKTVEGTADEPENLPELVKQFYDPKDGLLERVKIFRAELAKEINLVQKLDDDKTPLKARQTIQVVLVRLIDAKHALGYMLSVIAKNK